MPWCDCRYCVHGHGHPPPPPGGAIWPAPLYRPQPPRLVATRRSKQKDERCPYCHDDLGSQLVRRCAGCQALYHPGCARELGECATLGCDRRLKQDLPLNGRSGPGQSDPLRVVLWGVALSAAAFLVLLFLSLSAIPLGPTLAVSALSATVLAGAPGLIKWALGHEVH